MIELKQWKHLLSYQRFEATQILRHDTVSIRKTFLKQPVHNILLTFNAKEFRNQWFYLPQPTAYLEVHLLPSKRALLLSFDLKMGSQSFRSTAHQSYIMDTTALWFHSLWDFVCKYSL